MSSSQMAGTPANDPEMAITPAPTLEGTTPEAPHSRRSSGAESPRDDPEPSPGPIEAPSSPATSPAPTRGGSQFSTACGPTLDLTDGSLSLTNEALIVNGLAAEQIRLIACELITTDARDSRVMPLRNVLWVEVQGNQIVVDYACQLWRRMVRPCKLTFDVARQIGTTSPHVFTSLLMTRAYCGSQTRRKARVLVNPKAGSGHALQKWQRFAEPLFRAARMEFDVRLLVGAGDAEDAARTIELERYDLIVACSGDGTAHEIFNGLANRSDASRALTKLAVGHIPCGSGNAMACNLYGTKEPAMAALGIIKGLVTPLDLVSITYGDRRIISFLSQSLGMIAESDLGTEALRFLGSTRFELGVLFRSFRKKCYPFDLAIKIEIANKNEIREHYKRQSKVEFLRDNYVAARSVVAEGGLPPLEYGTVQDPVPEDWLVASYDKIGTFYCGNMAYMAPKAHFFPAAVASDGCLDLVLLRGDLPALTTLKILKSTAGKHFFDNPYVEYKKISAFRITPREQKDGYISIDGERIPFGPIQAEVHQGLGRVISRNCCYEGPGPTNRFMTSELERMIA